MTDTMTDDGQCLAAYLQHDDEQAFRAIVERYARLVYGVGLRKTGSTTLAEEITQNTFIVLARKAERLQNRKTLGGWLISAAHLEAVRAYRTECRRQRKMDAFSKEPTMITPAPEVSEWEEIIPDLDDALSKLSPCDRDAVVLRFYQKQSYRQIANLIGSSEDGSRKRVERAVSKLGRLLRQRGHTMPASVITLGLGTQFSKATPLIPTQMIAANALSVASNIPSSAFTINTLYAMTLSKKVSAFVIVVASTLITGIQITQHKALEEDLVILRERHSAPSTVPSLLGSASRSQGLPSFNNSAPVDPTTGNIDWREIIALFNKMNRYDSNAARDLFYSKLRTLNEREQFHAADIEPALEELRSNGAPWMMINLMKDSLAMFAANHDPEGVANLLLTNDAFPRHRMDIAMENWGKQAPDAALAWYQSRLEDGSFVPRGTREVDDAESYFGSLIAGIAQSDPSRAIDLLREVEEKSSERALSRLAFVLNTPEQREQLTSLLNQESDGILRDQVITSYSRSLTESESPDAAWNYLTRIDLSMEERTTVMAETILYESQRNFKATPKLLEWVGAAGLQFKDQPAIKQAVNHWRLLNEKAANTWAEEHRQLLE